MELLIVDTDELYHRPIYIYTEPDGSFLFDDLQAAGYELGVYAGADSHLGEIYDNVPTWDRTNRTLMSPLLIQGNSFFSEILIKGSPRWKLGGLPPFPGGSPPGYGWAIPTWQDAWGHATSRRRDRSDCFASDMGDDFLPIPQVDIGSFMFVRIPIPNAARRPEGLSPESGA